MQVDRQGESSSPLKRRSSLSCVDFTSIHRLGRGAYGDVFLVLKKGEGKLYAMKQIVKKKLSREQKQYQAMIEKQLLTCIKHRGVVTLKYAFQDDSMLYFIEEYCECGDFTSFITANVARLTEQAKIFYIAQMVNILEYLHTNGITHRDLKPQNLMLDRRGHLKLIDFGTAEITNCKLVTPQFKQHILKLKSKSEEIVKESAKLEESVKEEQFQEESPLKKRRSTFVGTCYYISPELLEHNYCQASADLWALGCIIYQLYYLETPFKDSYQFAVFQKIKAAEVSYPQNDSITPEAIDLIKKLLLKNPDQRLGCGATEELSYAHLKAHPYFRGLDVDKVFELSVPCVENLQEMEKNEFCRKEQFNAFSYRVESVLKTLASEVEIVKHEILEERSFVTYGYVLLALALKGQLYLITAEDPSQRKLLTLTQRNGQFAHLVNSDKFELEADNKVYRLRSSRAEEWVKAITAHFSPK